MYIIWSYVEKFLLLILLLNIQFCSTVAQQGHSVNSAAAKVLPNLTQIIHIIIGWQYVTQLLI